MGAIRLHSVGKGEVTLKVYVTIVTKNRASRLCARKAICGQLAVAACSNRLGHAIVAAILTKAMTMKSRHERLALVFGLLLACGARSPMDTPDEQSAVTESGSGGNLGSGGKGGVVGSGGRPSSGGNGGRTMGSGGSGGSGGGGGIQFGGAGGQAGFGPGGSPLGGRGGTAGASTGGTSAGGRGGSVMAGGTMMAGGMMNTGGSAGGAAGTIFRDGGVGGSGGVVGRDGGNVDMRPIVSDVGDGRPVIADASTCQGLASNEEMIDDLNDGDRFIPSVSGRAGAWDGSHDSSPSGKMYPDPSTGFVPSDSGDACRKLAAYTYGSGYVLWGANLWVGLGGPYDASKYKGISFWAKIDAGTSNAVRVAFPDKDTQPDGNICQSSVSSGPTACFDHYGYRINLTSAWTKYTVTFAQIAQENWGHAGTAFDPTTLYEILFQITKSANFGLWIDDIAFTM